MRQILPRFQTRIHPFGGGKYLNPASQRTVNENGLGLRDRGIPRGRLLDFDSLIPQSTPEKKSASNLLQRAGRMSTETGLRIYSRFKCGRIEIACQVFQDIYYQNHGFV